MQRGSLFLIILFLFFGSRVGAEDTPRYNGLLPEQEVEIFTRLGEIRRIPYDTPRWNTPEETINDMAGDCEDIAVLFGALVLLEWKIGGTVVIMERGSYRHVFYRINRALYDPFSELKYYDDEVALEVGWKWLWECDIKTTLISLRSGVWEN